MLRERSPFTVNALTAVFSKKNDPMNPQDLNTHQIVQDGESRSLDSRNTMSSCRVSSTN